MTQKKVCMLGGFAVGKTSLVSRFVSSIFSDKYLTTIGVKIEKKSVAVNGEPLDLILWDLYGEDEFQKMRLSYLRGAAGYLLVVDGTRRTTFDTARTLHENVGREIGTMPFVLVINKADLAEQWEVDEFLLAEASRPGWRIVRTSAKTGEGVEDAFLTLARGIAG